MNTQVTPFAWNDIALSEVVMIDGVPHMTKTAIGEWLEYADPRVSINKIIERNPHIRHWSVDVKLTSTDGKNYASDVYHPIGFLLIVMESGQPKANAKKIEVAEFVWSFAGPRRLNLRETDALIKRRVDLRRELAACTQMGMAQEAFADYMDISRLLGRHSAPLAALCPALRQVALEGV